MVGRIERVLPGEASEAALVQAIDGFKSGDPLFPVSVVVRSPLVGRDLRRRLPRWRQLAGVGFGPLSRLAELLAAPAEGERRPLSPTVLGAAVRAELSSRPGMFAAVARHPATAESLAATYKLLRRLADADTKQLSELGSRPHQLAFLLTAVRDRLVAGHYDQQDLFEAAARRLEEGTVDLSDLGPVVVYLPDPLGPHECRLLGGLAKRTDVLVLLAQTGDEVADRAMARLSDDLVEQGFVSPTTGGEQSVAKPLFGRVIGAPDAEEEVRGCLRLLFQHSLAGGDLGRVAVALPSGPAPGYLALVEELFEAAGMPWNGPGSGRASESGLGGLLSRLVSMLTAPGQSLVRSEVMAILSSPHLSLAGELLAHLSEASLTGRGLRTGAFERCSRRAGVVSGEREWDSRLSSLEARLARDGLEEEAAVSRDLRRIVGRLGRLATAFERAENWEDVSAATRAVAKAISAPGEEQESLFEALEELAYLQEIEPLEPSSRREERAAQISAAVGDALSGRAGSHGRFGVGPLVGSLADLAGVASDLLVVLGANEGALPGRNPEDPLLTPAEREQVPGLAELEHKESADRRHLCWLLCSAGAAVASYSRVARGSARPAYPSRFLAGDLATIRAEQVVSFSAGLGAVADESLPPADSDDLELVVALQAAGRGRSLEGSFLVELDDFGRRLRAETERARGGLNRFAGYVGAGAVDPIIFGAVMSATRMEALASCPLQFMFERLARIDALDAPDRLAVMEPMVRGNLIHDILERFVLETMEESGEALWEDPGLARLKEIADEQLERAARRGLGGKPIYWKMARSKILADLERFVALERQRLAEKRGVPQRTEMVFGEGEAPPVVVEVDGGRQVAFRGKIDRIDREPDGTLRVIDYKSGSDLRYKHIASDTLDGGRHLQLPIYAKAARQALGDDTSRVVAEYRFCSSEAGFRTLEVPLTTDVEHKLGEVIGTLCATIEGGTFPPRPGNGNELQPTNCRSCSYESICRLDRGQRWEDATEEPPMAAYVELVKGQRP